jgi:ribonuclease Z
LQILGANSAAPAHGRNQTSQLLNINEELILIDCGEGCQLQLRKYKAHMQRISTILISHLHGDHYLGLMGLLFTLHLQKKSDPLHIYGPPGLAEVIRIQLKYSNSVLHYPIEFIEWEPGTEAMIIDNPIYSVRTIVMKHRIPCMGFIFSEKPKKRRPIEKKIPLWAGSSVFKDLKDGLDLIHPETGELIPNNELTFPPKKSRSYAFFSDTLYSPELAEKIKGVNLLYHEATFMDDLRDRAVQTFHSTAKDAAMMASAAQVGKLLLGHFSIRYRDLNPLLQEARQIFPESYLATEGESLYIHD